MRERLLKLAEDEGDTVCDVAAREVVFCRGFDRFPTPLLQERFAWMAHDPDIEREELLDRIRRWIHAREQVLDLPTACDVMKEEGDLCRGWATFNLEKLAASYQELFGQAVEVVADPQIVEP
ncbi:MAG: hypothetical protein DWQ01_00915 [Planctomycetota bacterium]|nr:MAG: hypothetical protein DWQ01_00915 [Planctomycetota bacterium]